MSPSAVPHPGEKLRIGRCTVDVPSREVSAPGARRPRRITPKSMGVLLALVAHADKVVSRETLLATVWPDTLPGDDVLTQAVTQLRKAFAEARGDPQQYIETIAKGGYRLLAEVEWLDEPPSPVQGTDEGNTADDDIGPDDEAADPPLVEPAPAAVSPDHNGSGNSARSRRTPPLDGKTIVIGLLVLALVVVAASWWGARSDAMTDNGGGIATSPVATQQYQVEPFLITSAPGFEISPTLSPGGALVAYLAIPEGQRNIAVMLQTTAPVAPRQLTRPQGLAEDSRPRWSPDGRDIAFRRVIPGSDCRLMVVRATGGAERPVGECDPDNQPGYDWTPDGRGLILDRSDQPGLQILDLASGEFRAIDYPSQADDLDFSPRYSPDGQWIAFVRNSPMGDFWRLPADGGDPERLTHMNGEILGWDWTPDSRSLVYARRNDGVSRLYRHHLDTGVEVDLGIDNAEQPTMSRNVPSLAYVLRRPRFGIYRFALDGPPGPGEHLFASSGRDRVPSIAPDGRQLAFLSDRSGPFGLWWADVDVPGSQHLIEGIQPDSSHLPSWSSDSRRLLVVGNSTGQGKEQTLIHEVDPDSGRVAVLPVPVTAPVQAAYLPGPDGPDQRLLVLADRGDGRQRLNLFADSARPRQIIATLDDVLQIQIDPPRRRIVLVRAGQPGLWQVDFDLASDSIQAVGPDGQATPWHHAWSVAGDGGVYLARRTPYCRSLLVHQSMTDPVADAESVTPAPSSTRCLESGRRMASRAFSIDRSGRHLYITLAEHDGGDIGFATFDEVRNGSGQQSASH